MNWFEKLCRNAGLTLHKSSKAFKQGGGEKQEINRTVEEKQVDEKTILRRTTIEEIEIKRDDS